MNVNLKLALVIVVVFTAIALSFFGLIPSWLSLVCVISAGLVLMVESNKDNEEVPHLKEGEGVKKPELADTK